MAKSKPARITGTDNVRYLRVSSPGQVNTEYNPKGISLPAQREACINRERELGTVNVAEFIEPGRSAKSIEERPDFQDMISYLKAHPNVRYVSTYALSRFARNQYEDAIMMVTLERLGIELISATERNLDNTPAGRAMHGMLAVFNEYQVTASGLDIKYKMGRKVIEYGGTLGPAKIGYLNETVRFDGHKVNTIVADAERARYIPMAFELYATGKYSYSTLREALTEAGFRTKGNRRYAPRPVSIHKIGELLQDRYYLGYVTYDGVEYQGRHEPLVTQELFDRVQRVLQNERQTGARQRTHNHYLKGLLWCDRCQRRLIIMPGKGKSGEVYFYYICRGRQTRACDLPYMHVNKIERIVENHYATVRLSDDFRSQLRTMMEATRGGASATAKRLRDQLARQLSKLDLQEDRYLDLVGDPDWPKEKLSVKMRNLRDERVRLQERLAQADNPIGSGYEVLDLTLRLLADPLALYRTAKTQSRKVLNKAIFSKLYVDADEQGPYVASDELNEPFEAVLYARRESGFSEALERQERTRLKAGTSVDQTLATLLNTALGAKCSSKDAMVELWGFEPQTSCMPWAVRFIGPSARRLALRDGQDGPGLPISPGPRVGLPECRGPDQQAQEPRRSGWRLCADLRCPAAACTSRCVGGCFGLAPEDAGWVAVDLAGQVVDAVRGYKQVVDMESEVAVAPVQGPGLVGGGVAQARDRKAGPFRPGVLVPGSVPLDDRDVPWGDLALDADLVAGVLGNPRGAPSLDPCDV